MNIKNRVDRIAAEARAIESGVHPTRESGGAFSVPSASRPGQRHLVTYVGQKHSEEMLIHFSCSCPSGTARPAEVVPCWHAALVGRALEELGMARWDEGVWWASQRLLSAYAKIQEATPSPTR